MLWEGPVGESPSGATRDAGTTLGWDVAVPNHKNINISLDGSWQSRGDSDLLLANDFLRTVGAKPEVAVGAGLDLV